ncbi:UNVERIFIED_CONTAM: Protein sidekick-1 [Gekko kuhli]
MVYLQICEEFLLKYRLAGLPGEYQYKNITSAEINYCLIQDLIIWTQYEIQVASYNGAGLGSFSRAVAEYTLQGGEAVSRVFQVSGL